MCPVSHTQTVDMSVVVEAFSELTSEQLRNVRNLAQIRQYLEYVGSSLRRLARLRYVQHARAEIASVMPMQRAQLFQHLGQARQMRYAVDFNEWDLSMVCNLLMTKELMALCGYKAHATDTKPTPFKQQQCCKFVVGVGGSHECQCALAHFRYETSTATTWHAAETLDMGRFGIMVEGGFTSVLVMNQSMPAFHAAHRNISYATSAMVKLRNMISHLPDSMYMGVTNEIATCVLELLNDIQGSIMFELEIVFDRPCVRVELNRSYVQNKRKRMDEETTAATAAAALEGGSGARKMPEARPKKPCMGINGRLGFK